MRRAPTFTLLVPTHREDRPLRRCLDSVRGQLRRGDEVLVIGDTHSGPLPAVEALVRSYGPGFRYTPVDAGHHCYGHCQVNVGLSMARGSWIHVNDDDDVWAPEALATFRHVVRMLDRPRPILFRFKSYYGPTYWLQRGLFGRDLIGGHCLLAPNLPGKVGRFACAYNGDFDWLESTVDLHGGLRETIWRDEIIAIARPADVLVGVAA